VYWIRLVLITTAQTAQALPLPHSDGMLHPTRYD
jgi:hypothetical protein